MNLVTDTRIRCDVSRLGGRHEVCKLKWTMLDTITMSKIPK